MRTNITARHMELTDALKAYAEKKVNRLVDKYERVSDIEVVLDKEGQDHKVEMILKAGSAQRFVVTHSEEDAYACLDASIDKLERQLVKHKEKTHHHKGRASAGEATVEVIEAKAAEE